MTYWDGVRLVNLAVLAALLVTIGTRYVSGVRMLDPRNLMGDPSHLGLMRMGQMLLYLGMMVGYVEGLVSGLPGGPRVIAPLPGLVLILVSAHWGWLRDRWLRVVRGGSADGVVPQRPR